MEKHLIVQPHNTYTHTHTRIQTDITNTLLFVGSPCYYYSYYHYYYYYSYYYYCIGFEGYLFL